MAAEIVASGTEAMDPKIHPEGGEEKKTVMLRSEDGVEFVVSDAEASQCGRTVDFRIKYGNHIIPSGSDGGEASYSPIHLSVQGDTLSRVIQYSKLRNASGSQGLSDWDAEFIGGFDHQTLFDLIIAAKYLRNRGLLDLTCQAVAKLIKGKSFDEIRAMFNIRSYVPSLMKKNTVSSVEKVNALDRWLTATPAESSAADHDEDPVLTLEQNAVNARHLVRCQEFTAYDPQRNDFICTRFCSHNIAFFDLDHESKIVRGPPLDRMFQPISRYGVQSSLNVISLKVTESLVGYEDLSVFGTVLARDEVDYKCLYLFRRGIDDAQAITSPDDTLTLTDPCRALVLLNEIYFEIDLKIKCDGGEIRDFSSGVVSFERTRLPAERQTMTLSQTSWLSRVELACAHVYQPVEATVAINILKGPCNISRVFAWTDGNNITLYDSEADDTLTVVTRDGGSCSVPLTRHVVAVPFDEKLVLHLVGYDNMEHVRVTLGHSDEDSVFKMGLGEVQVKVAWTIIRLRRGYELEIIGDQGLLH